MGTKKMASIEAGMWLHLDCVNPIGIKFEHDGIVSAPPEGYSSAADIKVIHYAGSEPHGKRLISETTLAEFLVVGSSARVVNARVTLVNVDGRVLTLSVEEALPSLSVEETGVNVIPEMLFGTIPGTSTVNTP
eukprot:gene27902-biopygen8481